MAISSSLASDAGNLVFGDSNNLTDVFLVDRSGVLDSDGDGIPDAVEGSGDSDNDGVPDFEDLDKR